MNSKQSFFIETYGCQMNVYDTELVTRILTDAGYVAADGLESASIVMLNTCSVRESATYKIINRIAQIRQMKANSPATIGLLGCIASNHGGALLKQKEWKLDFMAGPDNYRHLPQLIQSAQSSQIAVETEFIVNELYESIDPVRNSGVNAWVAIMRGCNNFCSYCVVPYTRGRERSRAPQDILDEIKRTVDSGFKQVTLLGQNVNSYRYDKYDFVDLLEKVSNIEGLKRIRFASPHPKDTSDELIQLMAERKNICKHIHLPMQAGSTRILQLMNRTYTKEQYLELVAKFRSIIPQITITTDIIVGFPTETDEDFQDTLDVVNTVQYESAFMFKYSVREPSLAAKKYPDDVTASKKTERIVELNQVQRANSLKHHQAQIGQFQKVCIEAMGTKKSPNDVQARNDGNIIVILRNVGFKVGEFIQVEITEATTNVLKAKL